MLVGGRVASKKQKELLINVNLSPAEHQKQTSRFSHVKQPVSLPSASRAPGRAQESNAPSHSAEPKILWVLLVFFVGGGVLDLVILCYLFYCFLGGRGGANKTGLVEKETPDIVWVLSCFLGNNQNKETGLVA